MSKDRLKSIAFARSYIKEELEKLRFEQHFSDSIGAYYKRGRWEFIVDDIYYAMKETGYSCVKRYLASYHPFCLQECNEEYEKTLKYDLDVAHRKIEEQNSKIEKLENNLNEKQILIKMLTE